MTLNEIYNEYTAGSQGFVSAVETYCGFGISGSEIERIAERAANSSDFEEIWSNETWWTDEENN